MHRRRVMALGALVLLPGLTHAQTAARPHAAAIDAAKGSVVAIGTFQRTRSPQFQFLATGFVVGDGTVVATNAHAIDKAFDTGQVPEVLMVMLPTADGRGGTGREAARIAVDVEHDLALVKVSGTPLPALPLRARDDVRDGDALLFTGFPLGGALGLSPVTHRAMVSAVTPIAMPSPSAGKLDTATLRRLQAGPFPVMQLDATAYPGNSGSPLYDPATGEVVGIINMVFVKGARESALSAPSGITYAIPVVHLRELMKATR